MVIWLKDRNMAGIGDRIWLSKIWLGEVELMLVGNWGPSGHKKLGGIGNAFSIFASYVGR